MDSKSVRATSTRMHGVVIILLLAASIVIPFSTIGGKHNLLYELNFFMLCLFDMGLTCSWAFDLLSGHHSWGYGLPFELINFSPVSALLAIIICALLLVRVRPPRWFGIVTLVGLATSFHPTAGFEDVLYPYLPGAWLWGAGCLAAGLMPLLARGRGHHGDAT